MKKTYQRPVTQVLPIIRAVPMLATSPFTLEEPESGDVDPNTQIGDGLSREFDFDDDYAEDDYDY